MVSFCMSGWFTFWRAAVFYGKDVSDVFTHWIKKWNIEIGIGFLFKARLYFVTEQK